MIDNKITKIIPINKSINFIIHINNICNFKCTYCTAWHQVSNGKLNTKDISTIIETIYLLRKKWDNRYVGIDLTWWEPTLNNDLFDFVELFLGIENLDIQITTNLFRILHFDKELEKVASNKNINKLNFNISYHYFEYLWKEDIFIDSVKLLIKYNLIFTIKFLLPDNSESIDNFLIVKKKIFDECNIWESDCIYDLIINANWKVSTTYKKEVLDYFHNKQYLN